MRMSYLPPMVPIKISRDSCAIDSTADLVCACAGPIAVSASALPIAVVRTNVAARKAVATRLLITPWLLNSHQVWTQTENPQVQYRHPPLCCKVEPQSGQMFFAS